ncbi:hypothetical protein Nepgr_031275 [Nepenthes gracilis]|uniref:Uncharacterized protein n=1 Tax=Nepenthes gracilis TaxID=150966 RepID=A0AAD3TII6_NEPGR|nr:hypothetical protein Nepgr_031275 [Nepenthes gracilis]
MQWMRRKKNAQNGGGQTKKRKNCKHSRGNRLDEKRWRKWQKPRLAPFSAHTCSASRAVSCSCPLVVWRNCCK